MLTLIVDSMDHGKWCIPRSAVLEAKQFNSFSRPHMDCTAVLAHGHLVAVAFVESHVVKGADYTCELLCYVFDKLTRSGVDLRNYEIQVQSDNCTKECKNNSVLRLLGVLTSRRAVRCSRLQFCMSGHSHEDVDQFFGLLASFLSTKPELYTPEHFMNALTEYLSNRAVRSHEALRDVVKVECVRDWIHGIN